MTPPIHSLGVGDEAERFVASLRIVDAIISAALDMRTGKVAVHDGALRLGSLMTSLFGLANGLALVTDPSFDAVSHRLASMSLAAFNVASGVVPLDDEQVGELLQWPEAVRIDILRALTAGRVQ